jgi:hypothetical protein
MKYDISKYLYEVPDPYSIQDALNFIKRAYSDFESLSALHFAIGYKSMSEPRNSLKTRFQIYLSCFKLLPLSLSFCLADTNNIYYPKEKQYCHSELILISSFFLLLHSIHLDPLQQISILRDLSML